MPPKIPKKPEKGQRKLGFESIDKTLREPLAEHSESERNNNNNNNPFKKRKASEPPDDEPPSKSAPAETISKASDELRDLCTPELARQALQTLSDGNDGCGPAIRTEDGCLLGQKKTSHQTAKYILLNVPYEKRGRSSNGTKVKKRAQQLAHRLVVRAYKVCIWSPPLINIFLEGTGS